MRALLVGRAWFEGFMKRNPSITWRTAKQLGYERIQFTENDIVQWFADLQIYLLGIQDIHMILSNGNRVWNCDERAFPLSLDNSKVLARRGSKYMFKQTSEGHSQITVLACMSASGIYMPPYMVFKGERATIARPTTPPQRVAGWMVILFLPLWKSLFLPCTSTI